MHGRGGQPMTGSSGLEHRGRPFAGLLHDLGPVHEALPAVGHKLRLPGAPGAQRSGPLGRTSEVVDLVARLDDRAVDEAGRDRPHLSGGDRGHHFVEQRQAGGSVTAPDQRLALAVAGKRNQVGLREAFADGRGPLEDRISRGGPAVEQGDEPGGQHEVPPLRAVKVTLVDQALGPGEPAATAGRLATEDQGKREPEAASGGLRGFVPAEVAMVRPLPGRRAGVVRAGEVRRDREHLEVRGVKGRLRGCRGELVGRARPCVPREGVPSTVQSVGCRRLPPCPEDPPTWRQRQPPHGRSAPVRRVSQSATSAVTRGRVPGVTCAGSD